MSHFPVRRFFVLPIALAALALMIGCQGFSSSKSGSQSQNAQSGDLTASPASVSFGNVQIGTSQTLSDTLTNTGTSDLTITLATASSAAFSAAGLTLPLTLSAGQSATFTVVFSPQASGAASGNLTLTNNGSGSSLVIALSGTGVAAGSVTTNPTSLNFGNVVVGGSPSQTETLTNSGGQNLTISQAAITGTGFTYTGLSLPLTLAPNQSTTFGVQFAPTGAGTSNGDLSLTVSGSTATVDIALSGTGTNAATPATLAAIPVSLSFTDVEMGKNQTQTETVQNTGGSNATISGIAATGSGFSVSGASTPVTLSPGQTTSFTVTFAPQSSGNFTGSVSITSNASNPNLSVSLSGSAIGSSSGQLSVSPSTIAVGNVTVGNSGSKTGTLTATGASVVVSSADVGSSEFSISGLSFPVTLAAGQSATFTVTFTPQSSGAASTTASFTNNGTNSPALATLTGTGVAAPAYSVNLGWNADNSSNVVGYNVLRRAGTSGTFSQINTTLVAGTTYTDSSVIDGQTYYYETTAVNSSGAQSAPSGVVQAVIP
jgi:Abnormal spindle-like microcephaly-assoc'd, ASPM-SPD-2-Hydin